MSPALSLLASDSAQVFKRRGAMVMDVAILIRDEVNEADGGTGIKDWVNVRDDTEVCDGPFYFRR